jgi:4-amino-4-deoxy-L-arabinose transferase-like glycosyltransferase
VRTRGDEGSSDDGGAVTSVASGESATRLEQARLARTWTWLDWALFAALVAAYCGALVSTAGDLGYTRDEGFYYHAANTYGRWFELLGSTPKLAFERAQVDGIFRENHEHPVLMKSLFWLSHRVFGGLCRTEGLCYRLPSMLVSSVAVGVVFAWGRQVGGRLCGLVAALLLGCMPRVFFHSHLACFDMPIAALWLITTFVYFQSLKQRSWGWAVLAAVLYGLMLNTKHNSWLLPPALGAHAVGLHLLALWRGEVPWRRCWRWLPPRALVLMVLCGPLLMWLTWPWLWWDTGPRLVEYFNFHMRHVFYNMEFLGETYFAPPFPHAYATVPAITLLLAALGAGLKLVEGARLLRPRSGESLEAKGVAGFGGLWALSVLLSYAPWWSANTPIFGGTKHWITAYPFVALFAGWGIAAIARNVEQAWADRRWIAQGLHRWALGASAVAAPALMTAESHPYGLSAYTPLVGGAVGAATLGLNRTFWGFNTGSLAPAINAEVEPRGRLYLHDTLSTSFQVMQKDGTLRADIRASDAVSGSGWALYHHEQHMSRVEHMIWTDYGTVRPVAIAAHHGVPVAWLYERPR